MNAQPDEDKNLWGSNYKEAWEYCFPQREAMAAK